MKLRISLAVPIILILTLVSCATLYLGYQINSNALLETIEAREEDKANAIFFIINSIIEHGIKDLSGISRWIKEEKDLLAGLDYYYRSKGDLQPLQQLMDQLYPQLPLDFLAVLDKEGRVVYRADLPGQQEEPYLVWGMEEALAGEGLTAASKGRGGWEIRAMMPLKIANQVLGVVVLGTRLGHEFAQRMAAATGTQISFATVTGVPASSLPPEKRSRIDLDLVQSSILDKKAIFRIDYQARQSFMYAPLKVEDEILCVVITDDTTKITELLDREQRKLFFSFLGIFALVSCLGAALTMVLVRPLRRLQGRAQEVIKEFAGTAPPLRDSGNEIQTLTRAFELMVDTSRTRIIGLQEERAAKEKSRSLLAAALEATADGILAVDREGRRILGYNRKFADIWQIPGTLLNSGDCEKLRDFLAEQVADRRAFLQKTAEWFAHPEFSGHDILVLTNGKIIERFSQPQRLGPEIVGRVWSYRDITARREADEALKYRLALEKILAAISTSFINLTGEAMDGAINQALQTIGAFVGVEHGYLFCLSPEGRWLEKTHAWQAQAPDPRLCRPESLEVSAFPWLMEQLQGLKTIQIPRQADLPPAAGLEKELFQSMGINSALFVPLVSGGEILGFLGLGAEQEGKEWAGEDAALLKVLGEILASALARHRAEEALQEGERFLAGIFDSIQDGLCILDDDFNILRVNPAVVNFPLSQPLVGRKCYEVFHGRTAPCDICPSRQTLETGKVAWKEMQIQDTRGNGDKYLEVYTYPLLDRTTGRTRGVVEYIRDITARKQAEEALRRSEEQLRQAVKLEAVGRLAGGVAHDFNNILTAITGYSDLLLLKLRHQPKLRQDVQEIRQAAGRAAALVGQLLAFSRKQLIQPQALDLNELLRRLEQMLGRIMGEDIEIVFRPGAALGQVKADPGQLEQVVVNLAVNARDAMPQGGQLTLETANVELDEADRLHPEAQPGPYVMLTLRDTGVGLDPETQAHIFEPFFTTKEVGRGTGLGLFTVYGIVQQSGGHIRVLSEPGRGTAFQIHLPRVEVPEEPAISARVVATPPRGIENILLVEDEELVREVVRCILEKYGYTVLAAADGGEALDLSERHPGPIHLLLTDVVMPRMSGREVADRLARQRPEMKVIFMSGHSENVIAHHGVLDPGIVFLQKPFKQEVLVRRVREVLDKRPANHQDRGAETGGGN